MAQPAQAAEPLLAREYSKLFTAASKASEVRLLRALLCSSGCAGALPRARPAWPHTPTLPPLPPLHRCPQVFTTKEKAQLDVYGTWAVLRNQLAATDDSFAFNKARARLLAGLLPCSDSCSAVRCMMI